MQRSKWLQAVSWCCEMKNIPFTILIVLCALSLASRLLLMLR